MSYYEVDVCCDGCDEARQEAGGAWAIFGNASFPATVCRTNQNNNLPQYDLYRQGTSGQWNPRMLNSYYLQPYHLGRDLRDGKTEMIDLST